MRLAADDQSSHLGGHLAPTGGLGRSGAECVSVQEITLEGDTCNYSDDHKCFSTDTEVSRFEHRRRLDGIKG